MENNENKKSVFWVWGFVLIAISLGAFISKVSNWLEMDGLTLFYWLTGFVIFGYPLLGFFLGKLTGFYLPGTKPEKSN